MNEGSIARKRLSIYLVLFCWGLAVAMMHPGLSTMIAGTILLFFLCMLRWMAHFEGQYMMKAAEAEHPAHAHTVIWRHLLVEGLIGIGIFGTGLLILGLLVRHIPWLWFPSTSS